MLMQVITFEALVRDVRGERLRPDARQCRRTHVARGAEGLGQRLSFRRGRREAAAGDDPGGAHRQQQVQALVPAQPVTPPEVSPPRQPAPPAPAGVAHDQRRCVRLPPSFQV